MADHPAFEPHRYRSACGNLELFARIHPGEGPTLLLMHGLTRNSADFEPLVEHLAGRYRLIVPDQRGRGLSEWDPEAGNYRPDVYAGDMFALLDGLGVEKAALIGTSMGGLMAMLMGAVQPDRIPAIVFNDVGPVIDPIGLARIQGYIGPTAPFSSWDEIAARCGELNAQAFPDFGHDDWLAFARRLGREAPDGTISFDYDPAIAKGMQGDDASAVPPDLWPLWDALSAKPVLVLRGELSDVLSPETVKEMAARHTGPFTHVDIVSRGHAPMLDEPAALQAILLFLRNHVG
jgi:pimeloyl-ACP methyl ester carboxylesterase